MPSKIDLNEIVVRVLTDEELEVIAAEEESYRLFVAEEDARHELFVKENGLATWLAEEDPYVPLAHKGFDSSKERPGEVTDKEMFGKWTQQMADDAVDRVRRSSWEDVSALKYAGWVKGLKIKAELGLVKHVSGDALDRQLLGEATSHFGDSHTRTANGGYVTGDKETVRQALKVAGTSAEKMDDSHFEGHSTRLLVESLRASENDYCRD